MEQRNNRTVWVIATVVIAALLGVVAYALTMNRSKTDDTALKAEDNSSQQKTDESNTATNKDQNNAAATISFTDKGFAAQNYTVKSGNEVKVENNSSMQLQFSSNNHPTHTEETELNLKVLAPGESVNFTPTKVGTWGFHDHLHSQYTGELTVTE